MSETKPLSAFSYDWGWGLVAPKNISGADIGTFYEFYEYVDTPENTYYNNVIDWENPMTYLNAASSLDYKSWAGTNGIMQNLISYELTKGLKLFTSAANIQYNN